MNDHVCTGCGHPRSQHYRDVDDVVRCLVEVSRRLGGFEVSVLGSVRCDCAGFISPQAEEQRRRDEADRAKREREVKELIAAVQPVDRSARVLTSGALESEKPDYRDDRGDGQQKDYVVLTDAERAKGFVRPVRLTYTHIGPPGPKHPVRDLTTDEQERHNRDGHQAYVKFEGFTEPGGSTTGKFWTQAELDRVGKGCFTPTTMSQAIAETYARDPHFYSSTFCVHCGKHLPVGEYGEFIWTGTNKRVGT